MHICRLCDFEIHHPLPVRVGMFHRFSGHILSVRPSARLSFSCLSFSSSVFLFVCLSLRLSFCPSVCPSVFVSVRFQSLSPCVRPSFCPSFFLFVCPSLRLAFCPSLLLSVRPSV